MSTEDIAGRIPAPELKAAIHVRVGDSYVPLEGLLAERDALRAESVEWSSQYQRLSDETAALRAQLDSMTVETRVRRVAVDGQGKIIGGVLIPEKRRVGPWVEVSE